MYPLKTLIDINMAFSFGPRVVSFRPYPNAFDLEFPLPTSQEPNSDCIAATQSDASMPPRILWRSWDPDRLQRANMSPTTGVPCLAQVQRKGKRCKRTSTKRVQKQPVTTRNIRKASGWRMRWQREPQHLHRKLLRAASG